MHTSKSAGKLVRCVAPLALLLLASGNLYAQQPMSVPLKGDAEVPAVSTSASGSALIDVRPDHTVSGSIKFSGMVATMAHIHEAAVGKNGPPIVTLTKGADDSFSVPADTRLSDAQYASYQQGNLYVNVHSAKHPGGEIRAQLPYKAMKVAY